MTDKRRRPPRVRASKTAAIEAARQLDADAVEAMLDANPAILGVTDRSGRNLLHIACAAPVSTLKGLPAKQSRLAGLLLDRGLAIDQPYGRDTCTALFEAVARARSVALVRFLLQRGADVNAAPGGGLFAAGWWQDLDILEVLLEAGADIEVVVGVTPFLGCWAWQRFDAAKFLACRGANVNVQDVKGRTALHLGIEKEFEPSLLAWLVEHGASPDIADREGVSARLKASRKRDRRFLAALGS